MIAEANYQTEGLLKRFQQLPKTFKQLTFKFNMKSADTKLKSTCEIKQTGL